MDQLNKKFTNETFTNIHTRKELEQIIEQEANKKITEFLHEQKESANNPEKIDALLDGLALVGTPEQEKDKATSEVFDEINEAKDQLLSRIEKEFATTTLEDDPQSFALKNALDSLYKEAESSVKLAYAAVQRERSANNVQNAVQHIAQDFGLFRKPIEKLGELAA